MLIPAHRPSFTHDATTRALSGRVLCSAPTSAAVIPTVAVIRRGRRQWPSPRPSVAVAAWKLRPGGDRGAAREAELPRRQDDGVEEQGCGPKRRILVADALIATNKLLFPFSELLALR
jgi:hypothetical protein